jgi:hypothetical protein
MDHILLPNADLDSSDLEFMKDGGVEQLIGIRFPSVDLADPVNRAWILFDVDEAEAWEASQSVTIGIYGELAVNSAPISAAANDISSRTVTNAMSLWMPGATNVVHEELYANLTCSCGSTISPVPYALLHTTTTGADS